MVAASSSDDFASGKAGTPGGEVFDFLFDPGEEAPGQPESNDGQGSLKRHFR